MRSYENPIRKKEDQKDLQRSSCVVRLFPILWNVNWYSGIIGSKGSVNIQKFIEVAEFSMFRLELMNEFPRVLSDFLGKVSLFFPEMSRFFTWQWNKAPRQSGYRVCANHKGTFFISQKSLKGMQLRKSKVSLSKGHNFQKFRPKFGGN